MTKGQLAEIARRSTTLLVVTLLWMLQIAAMPGFGAAQGEWVTTGPPIASLASDGNLVLLVDGTPLLFGLTSRGVQQYHPSTGTWTEKGSLQVFRAGGTVTLLSSGIVLLAGGSDFAGEMLSRAEVHDPTAATSTFTGSMRVPRTGHQATLPRGQSS